MRANLNGVVLNTESVAVVPHGETKITNEVGHIAKRDHSGLGMCLQSWISAKATQISHKLVKLFVRTM